MKKCDYICIGAAVVSVAALAIIAAKKCGCCCEKPEECHNSRAKRGKCCSVTEKSRCESNEKEIKPETNEMGEEKEPPYYSENYYVNDQNAEE